MKVSEQIRTADDREPLAPAPGVKFPLAKQYADKAQRKFINLKDYIDSTNAETAATEVGWILHDLAAVLQNLGQKKFGSDLANSATHLLNAVHR